jgi:Cof subfamily protein (haloacid dehalogenase superfamily)
VTAELPIGLVALDIDGTLVGEDLVLRERTRDVIREIVRCGVRVSLVTGRMASSAWVFADVLGLRDPIVAYQGALIRSMPAPDRSPRHDGRPPIGRLLRHRPLPPDVARAATEWCRANGLHPHVNHLEQFIIGADDPKADDYSAYLGARARIVPDLGAAIVRPVTKVIANGEAGRPAAIVEQTRRRFVGRAEVTVSHPRFLEFVAPGVSKGMAIGWLARRAGVPLGRVLAIGDQWNDREMLAIAGHGVAMPSAPAEVRAVARYIAPPLEEEGAAQLLEDLVLAGPRAAAANARRWAEASSVREARPPVGR